MNSLKRHYCHVESGQLTQLTKKQKREESLTYEEEKRERVLNALDLTLETLK